MNIEKLINTINIRPQMFVSPVKIDYIYYFLFGYISSKDNPKNVDLFFKNNFSKWALDWVNKNIDSRYKFENYFWYHMFQSVSQDENEAVELFFKVSKEFFVFYHSQMLE